MRQHPYKTLKAPHPAIRGHLVFQQQQQQEQKLSATIPTPSPSIINISPPSLGNSIPSHHDTRTPTRRAAHRAHDAIAGAENGEVEQVAAADELAHADDLL